MSALSLSLPRALSVEVLKYRRTLALGITIIAPLFLVLLNFCIFWLRDTPMVTPEENAWNKFGYMNLNPSAFLLFPMFITLLAVFFFQIEHQNNTWKHLWVLPTPRSQQYLAKVLALLSLVFLSLLLFIGFIGIGGLLLSVLRPELGFQSDVGFGTIAQKVLYSGAASLSLIAFQFWFSFRWRNLLAPLALGLGGLVSANIIMSWEHAIWHPYTSSMLAISRLDMPENPYPIEPMAYGIGVGLLVFVLAYFDGQRRILKG